MESNGSRSDPGILPEWNSTDLFNYSLLDSTCSNDSWENCTRTDHPSNSNVNILLPVVSYSILFVIGAYGNVTVFVTLLRAHRKSRISLMITHLTMADLVVTFIMIPMEIVWRITNEWRAGNAACKIFLMLRAFGLYLSSNVLVCVSMDRYFAILYPLKVNDARHRSKTMLAVAWIFSFVCAFPQVKFFISHFSFLVIQTTETIIPPDEQNAKERFTVLVTIFTIAFSKKGKTQSSSVCKTSHTW